MAMAQTTLHASSPRSLLSRLGGYLTRRRPKRLDPRMLSEHSSATSVSWTAAARGNVLAMGSQAT